jgi:hypothetical protein
MCAPGQGDQGSSEERESEGGSGGRANRQPAQRPHNTMGQRGESRARAPCYSKGALHRGDQGSVGEQSASGGQTAEGGSQRQVSGRTGRGGEQPQASKREESRC